MDFNEALKAIYSRADREVIIHSPMTLYSILLDMVSSSLQDQKTAKALLLLCKATDVFSIFSTHPIKEGLNLLLPYREEIAKEVGVLHLKLSVRGVVSLFDEKYFDGKPLEEKRNNAVVQKAKPQPQVSISPKQPPKKQNRKNNNIVVKPANVNVPASPKPSVPPGATTLFRSNHITKLDLKGVENINIIAENVGIKIWRGGLNGAILKSNQAGKTRKGELRFYKDPTGKNLDIKVSDWTYSSKFKTILNLELDLPKGVNISITSDSKVELEGNIGTLNAKAYRLVFYGRVGVANLDITENIHFSGKANVINATSHQGDIFAIGSAYIANLKAMKGSVVRRGLYKAPRGGFKSINP